MTRGSLHGLRNRRGEQGRRHQRRRRRFTLAAQRRHPQGPCPDDQEIAARLAALPPFEPRIQSKWLRRYARMVTSADTGAVLRD